MDVPDNIINVMAETYVNRIRDDPTAPRCEFCGLPHQGQKCHKLINVAVANRILKQRPQLERQILAENKTFPVFERFRQPFHSGRGRGDNLSGRGRNDRQVSFRNKNNDRRGGRDNMNGRGRGGQVNRYNGSRDRALRIHSLAEEIAQLKLNEDSDTENDMEVHNGDIMHLEEQEQEEQDYIRMFQLEDSELETAFLDDDDSVTLILNDDMDKFNK